MSRQESTLPLSVKTNDAIHLDGTTIQHPELEFNDGRNVPDRKDEWLIHHQLRDANSVQAGTEVTHYNIGFSGMPTAPPSYVFSSGGVNHSYFAASSVNMGSPAPTPTGSATPPAYNYNQYYAPTSRFPNQCFEIGTVWTVSAGKTLAQLFVYDWCITPSGQTPGTAGTFVAYITENAAFTNLYVSAQSPYYEIQVSTVATGGTTYFVPYIVELGPNGTSGKKDEILGTVGSYAGKSIEEKTSNPLVKNYVGWSYFESYEIDGLCNAIPAFSETGYTYAELDGTSSFGPTNFEPYTYNSVSPAKQAACNVDDKSGKGYWWKPTYLPQPGTYDTIWQMISTASAS